MVMRCGRALLGRWVGPSLCGHGLVGCGLGHRVWAWPGGGGRSIVWAWPAGLTPPLSLSSPPPPASSSLGFTSSPSPFSSSSPENVEDSGLDSPSHAAPGPSPEPWVPRPGTPQSPPGCRVAPPESRGSLAPPPQPPDSPQHLAPSPGPWGLEAGSGGESSTHRRVRRGSCRRAPREGLARVGARRTVPWLGMESASC